MQQAHNKHTSALATLASKIDVLNEIIDVSIAKRTLRATAVYLIPANPIDEQIWRTSIIQNLIQPSLIVTTEDLKDFFVIMASFIV